MKISSSFLSRRLLVGIAVSAGFAAFFPAFGAGPKGTIYTFTVPKQGVMIGDARYYCWVPDAVATLRCVIVHQHGCTTEGVAPAGVTDLQWVTLAKKWNSVLVVPMLTTGPNGTPDCYNWDDISNGSGNCFMAMLDTLARRSGHQEIETIPWALWGHSGGSMWITAMTGKYPERVVGAVAQACATEISNVSAALRVPVLHHNGKLDLCYNDTYFSNGRKLGALWAHAINPDAASPLDGHMTHDMRLLALPWLDACLSSRLPEQAGGTQLRDMDTTSAWLGDTATRAISDAKSFAGNKLAACWFPNESFARKWKQYMATGRIIDSTLPPAPYNLTGTFANRRITLKWDADADFGGIKTFTVYRNGTFFQSCIYTTTSPYSTIPGFQRWGGCDDPYPIIPPDMTFTDSTVTDTGTYSYQIAIVNWSDVAGTKSVSLALKRGQVTKIKDLPSEPESPHRARSLRLRAGAGRIGLSAGMIDIYDLRGRLLKTVEISFPAKVDVRALVGSSAENIMIVKYRFR